MQRVDRVSQYDRTKFGKRDPRRATDPVPGIGHAEPVRALLSASDTMQRAPEAGVWRHPSTVRIDPIVRIETPSPGTDTAGPDRCAPGLWTNEPAAVPHYQAKSRRSVPAVPSLLLGGLAVLAVSAAAGGYFLLGTHPEARRPVAVAAGAVQPVVLTTANGGAVGPRTPAKTTAGDDPPVERAVPAQADATEVPSAAGPAAEASAGLTPAPASAEDRRAMIRSVQRALSDAGFDPGPSDGLMGPKTRAAVKQYQRRAGVDADGEIDAQLLQQLTAATVRTDADIPPARLPAPEKTSVSAEAAPATGRTAKLGGIDGLLSAFHGAFGPADDTPVDAAARAEARR